MAAHRFRHPLTFLLCSLSASPWAELSLQVVDANGKLAPNAVVVAPDYPGPRATGPFTIDQRNLQFQPHVVVAPVGEPVYFPNSDKTRHQVYSFSAPNNFELKLYRQEDAPPVTFASEGVVELGCNIHDSMKGYIYVTRATSFAVSGAAGRIDLAIEPQWPLRLQLWHPSMGSAAPAVVTLAAPGPLTLPSVVADQQPVEPSSLRDRLQRFKKNND